MERKHGIFFGIDSGFAGEYMKSKCFFLAQIIMILGAAIFSFSCVKTIPESKTVPLSDVYLDAENSKPWFKIADGDYTLLSDIKGLAASITVRFEILGDAKKNSIAEQETLVRTEAKLAAGAELTRDFSNKAYYLIPLDAYGNVISVTGGEGTAGYFKGVASDVFTFISFADTGAVRPFPFKITVEDRRSLAAIMDLRGFRIMEEGAVSYPVAGGGSGPQQRVYKVGTDLAPGEYVIEPGNADIKVRYVPRDGNADEYEQRNPGYVVLQQGDTLAITGEAKVTPGDKVSLKPSSLDDIPAQMYKVGKDIPAGKYTLIGMDGDLTLYTAGSHSEVIAYQSPGKEGQERQYLFTILQNGNRYRYDPNSINGGQFGKIENGVETGYGAEINKPAYSKYDGRKVLDWEPDYDYYYVSETGKETAYISQKERDNALAYVKSKSHIEAQNGQYLLVSRNSRAKRVK
jgi:hypothetical protein